MPEYRLTSRKNTLLLTDYTRQRCLRSGMLNPRKSEIESRKLLIQQ